MPPTKATSRSTRISFSWWVCIGRSRLSSATWILVPAVRPRRTALTLSRHGRKTGSGAPAHSSTRTGMRSASSARTSRSTRGEFERVRAKSGVTAQPAMLTPVRADIRTSAMRGSAVAPSTSSSRELPGRGGGSPAAHRPDGAGVAGDEPRPAAPDPLPRCGPGVLRCSAMDAQSLREYVRTARRHSPARRLCTGIFQYRPRTPGCRSRRTSSTTAAGL